MATFENGWASDDPTVVDAPDLTAHVEYDEDYDTPVTTHACKRCGKACLEAGPDDMRGGLPDFCAHSADGRWRFCSTPPRRIVYYPDGR